MLPGSAEALIMITSRRRLSALSQATPITLEVMEPGEAAELFVRLVARTDLGSQDAGVVKVIQLCGYLPLAISLMAGQLNHHPSWTTSSLAVDLASAKDRLAVIRAENTSVAAAFDLSYGDLSHDQQRLLRRLSLHPGIDTDAYVAAALDDTDVNTVRPLLDELYSHHLLDEPVRGRYRFHDLIRQYARGVAAADEAAEHTAATKRLLDYYVYTSRAAQRYLARIHHSAGMPAVVHVPQSRMMLISNQKQANTWMEAERHNLLAAADCAAENGWPRHVIDISTAMHAFLRTQGYWSSAFNLHQLALDAARRDDDHPGEACVLDNLGYMQYLTGDFMAAAESYKKALSLYRELEDRQGQANTLRDLGQVQQLTGDHPAASASLREALSLYRELDDRQGQANTLRNLGVVHYLTGDYPAASASIREAFSLYRDIDDTPGQAGALRELGYVEQLSEDYPAAVRSLSRALSLYRDLGDRNGQANALSLLGVVQQATGNYLAATASQEGALTLYRDLGNRLGEANALNSMGELLASSNVIQARDCHEQALEIAHAITAAQEEARALEGIGRCYLRDGHPDNAGTLLRRALAIYQRLGSPHVRRVEATLRDQSLLLAEAVFKTETANQTHDLRAFGFEHRLPDKGNIS